MMRPESSLIEGAFTICTAFHVRGFTAVLCGGSAATYYAPDAYMSADNDFVLTVDLSRAEIIAVLGPLGFRQEGRIYVHDAVSWTADFPRGPLQIGRDLVTGWLTERRGDEILHVITPTDSVRDRFMSYFAWNDFSGLTQAVAVALAQPERVDLKAIREWTERELATTPVYERAPADRLFAEIKRKRSATSRRRV